MFFKKISDQYKDENVSWLKMNCSLVDGLGRMNTETCFCSSVLTFLTTCFPAYTETLIDLHKVYYFEWDCCPWRVSGNQTIILNLNCLVHCLIITLKSTISFFMVWIHYQFICWLINNLPHYIWELVGNVHKSSTVLVQSSKFVTAWWWLRLLHLSLSLLSCETKIHLNNWEAENREHLVFLLQTSWQVLSTNQKGLGLTLQLYSNLMITKTITCSAIYHQFYKIVHSPVIFSVPF